LQSRSLFPDSGKNIAPCVKLGSAASAPAGIHRRSRTIYCLKLIDPDDRRPCGSLCFFDPFEFRLLLGPDLPWRLKTRDGPDSTLLDLSGKLIFAVVICLLRWLPARLGWFVPGGTVADKLKSKVDTGQFYLAYCDLFVEAQGAKVNHLVKRETREMVTDCGVKRLPRLWRFDILDLRGD